METPQNGWSGSSVQFLSHNIHCWRLYLFLWYKVVYKILPFSGGALKTETVVCNHLYCFDTITLTWSEIMPENPERINMGGRDCANFVVSGNTAFLYGMIFIVETEN